MIAYKFLDADGAGPFTGFRWSLPGDEPGAWVVTAGVDPCRAGIHACRADQLPYWVGRRLYEIELDGEVLQQGSKLVAGRARLVRRVDAWDERMRDAYTRMCADRALVFAASGSPALEAWAAVVEPSVPEGPALLGFVAARIAEQLEGPAGYYAERAHQAEWLTKRLGLAAT